MPLVKKDVKVGGYYACRVGDHVVAIHIRTECLYGGWNATNLATRKEIRIRTAARLRWELTEQEARAFGKQYPNIADIRHKMRANTPASLAVADNEEFDF